MACYDMATNNAKPLRFDWGACLIVQLQTSGELSCDDAPCETSEPTNNGNDGRWMSCFNHPKDIVAFRSV